MINLAFQTKTGDFYCIQMVEVIENAVYSGQVTPLTKTRVSEHNNLVSLQVINKNYSAIFIPNGEKVFAFYIEDGNYTPEENDLEEINKFVKTHAHNLIRLVKESSSVMDGIDRVFDPSRSQRYKGDVSIAARV